MSVSTFKILFYFKKKYLNNEEKAGIMIRITLNSEVLQFSSKLDVQPGISILNYRLHNIWDNVLVFSYN